jgi:hypothetical protein
MRHRKIDLYRDFAAGVYLSEAQNPMPSPHNYTLYTCMIYHTYSHEGGGGRELNQREGESGNSSQSWVENTNITDCIFRI